LLVLADETARRDSLATSLRVQRARLEPAMQLELWDTTARVTYDQALWQELVSLRFIEQHKHLIIVGPVGVGKHF
jgi:DNA replication protein DnaC